MYRSLKNRKGLGLIELLLVVGLVAAIIVGGFVTYQRVSLKHQIETEVKNITSVVTSAKGILSSTRYVSLDNNTLQKLKVIPSELTLADGSIRSSMAQSIIASSIYNNKEKLITHLKLEFKNFQAEHCGSFVAAIEPTTDFISIEKSILKNEFDPDNYKQYRIDNAAALCADLGSRYNTFPLILIFKV